MTRQRHVPDMYPADPPPGGMQPLPICDHCGSRVYPQPARCTCGHPVASHHRTAAGKMTFCSVWSPEQCPCIAAKEGAA